MMTKAEIPPDDPTIIWFCILAKFDGLASGMGADFKRDGANLIASIRKVMGETMKAELGSIPDNLATMMEAKVSEISNRIAANSKTVIDNEIDREAARRNTFRLGGLALGAVLFASVVGGYGYMIGRDTVSSDAAKFQALVNLPDGGTWLGLARLNDIGKAMAQSCTAGEGRVISGGRQCDLTLWVSQPVGNSQGVNLVRLSFAEWGNKLGIWGVLAIGAALGFLGGRLWKRKAAY
ncbi:hypothetical protein ACC685_33500 [Rhizobium ruizarguesonis]